MNKKNNIYENWINQFFWTNTSEDDMKDNGLFITENTEPIALSTWDRIKFETGWEEWQKDWNIREEKRNKRSSVTGVVLGFFGMTFNYVTAVNAFNALDSSYADSANLFIGVSAVGFAAFAGYMAYTFITSSFDWFNAKKKLTELGG
jgi:hypothetical protein